MDKNLNYSDVGVWRRISNSIKMIGMINHSEIMMDHEIFFFFFCQITLARGTLGNCLESSTVEKNKRRFLEYTYTNYKQICL